MTWITRGAWTEAPARSAAGRAGLARVALAENDAGSALTALQALLDHVAAGGTLDASDDPRLIELTCHQTLACIGDPHAADWLDRAHTALLARAGVINDTALRQGFLQNIPHHRKIMAATAWANRGLPGASSAKVIC